MDCFQSQYDPSIWNQIFPFPSLQHMFHEKISQVQNSIKLAFYQTSQSQSLPAQNGGTPLSKIYSITPALHISASFP